MGYLTIAWKNIRYLYIDEVLVLHCLIMQK